MATNRFLGRAKARANVITVQVTAYDAATTYSLTVNGKSVTTIAAGSVNATATALAAAWNAATEAEFAEQTASANTDTVTLTAELRAEGGTAVRKVSEERSSSELQGKRGGYGFSAQLPLGDVTPGIYVIHLEARANVGDRPTVSKDIQIRVR